MDTFISSAVFLPFSALLVPFNIHCSMSQMNSLDFDDFGQLNHWKPFPTI